MNCMEEVAKMLGVELGEYFEIYRCGGLYFLSYSGLYHVQSGSESAKMLSNLLSGEYKIKRKHWKPKYGESYYCVNSTGYVCEEKWYGDVIDTLYYKLGNCYKCKHQAEASSERWVSFYRSDEVLEV